MPWMCIDEGAYLEWRSVLATILYFDDNNLDQCVIVLFDTNTVLQLEASS